MTFTYSDTPCTFSTTGYTGEKGGELIIHNNQVKEIFEQLIKNGATPCGLGARDSLRLEKGYSLYGNELDDKTNPFEAGLKWTIKMEKKDFIGKSALKYQLTSSVKKKIKGFTLIDRGIARHGYKVYNGDGKIIGIVTSGGYSPCTKKNIGLAMIDTDHQGDQIHIDIRNKKYRAKIRKRVMNY